MARFSLKDIQKNGKPYLYYEEYKPEKYEERKMDLKVKMMKEAAERGVPFDEETFKNKARTVSRRQQTIYLGAFNPTEKSIFELKKMIIDKAQKKKEIDELKQFKKNLEVTEEMKQALEVEYARNQLQHFIRTEKLNKLLELQTPEDIEEIKYRGETVKDYLLWLIQEADDLEIEELMKQKGIGKGKAKLHYIEQEENEYFGRFAELEPNLAKIIIKNKQNKEPFIKEA